MTQKVNWNREELMGLYYDDEMSGNEIAKLKGVCLASVYNGMKRFEIERRSKSDSLKLAYKKGKRPTIYLPVLLGENHPAWKGGRTITPKGYVLVYHPGHPRGTSFKRKYVLEHLLVWERTHGKLVPEGHIIHHLNGIKDDNRPENLVAVPIPQHERNTRLKLAQKRIRELEQRVEMLIPKSEATEDRITELEDQGITPILVSDRKETEK